MKPQYISQHPQYGNQPYGAYGQAQPHDQPHAQPHAQYGQHHPGFPGAAPAANQTHMPPGPQMMPVGQPSPQQPAPPTGMPPGPPPQSDAAQRYSPYNPPGGVPPQGVAPRAAGSNPLNAPPAGQRPAQFPGAPMGHSGPANGLIPKSASAPHSNAHGPPMPGQPLGLPPQNVPQGGPQAGPPSGPQAGPPSGPQAGPPSGPQAVPHGGPPPGVPQGMPPAAPLGMPQGGMQSAPQAQTNPNLLANQLAGMSVDPQRPPGAGPPMGAQGWPGVKPGTYPSRPAYGGQGDSAPMPINGMPPLPGQPPQTSQPPHYGQPHPHPQQAHPPQQPSYMNGLAANQAGHAMGHPPMPQPNPMQAPFPPQPGIPPMPGYPAQHDQREMHDPGMGYANANVYQQQQQQQAPAQQARRLDPANMPSPIQVMYDDQQKKSGVFSNRTGEVPPLVTTDFVSEDNGNCNPRFIRSSLYSVPVSGDVLKQTAMPFAVIISPFARTPKELPPPIVDMGEVGPVRCNRCKAYMCPYMQFVDGGRRFLCPFCKATSEVPEAYFQHLDHTGQRVDRFERPELIRGAYEYIATKEYCKDSVLPKPPAIIFLIDVSYNNIKSGMVNLLCAEMKRLLSLLPVDPTVSTRPNMRVGFITYNNTVHFYNIKGCLAQPQMMVVGDVQDMFMPLLDGFLCDVEESGTVIDALMEQIPAMFAETRETETVLAPAIQAGMEALRAAQCAGKLLVFHSSLPIADAPGKLSNRDDRKLLGTDKEKTVLTPQNNTYYTLGQECVSVGCSVDLFIFNNAYIDLATVGQVSRLTGGQIYKYTYFQADTDGDRLITDLSRNISRPTGYDGVMRVRTSTGIRATDFYGHFYMSNTRDMEVASIDADKAVAVEIKHDDKLNEEEGVFIQVALLYTSCGGQRRLRILNLSLSACVQMTDMFRTCDLDSFINFISKQACFRLLDSTPKQVKEGYINRTANILACYRKHCSSPSSPGQLILPETMKLLPLALNCVFKSDAISGGSDMSIDDRSFVMQAVMTMDVPSSVVYFYPQLVPLHLLTESSTEVPFPIRCSAENLANEGVYILDNGIHMFLWIGLAASPEWINAVFGVPSVNQVDSTMIALPELDTPLSHLVRGAIQSIRDQRPRAMRLTVVRQRDKMEIVLKHFLVEDRGMDGSSSYIDFLCHMHKEVRNLMT